MDVSTVPRGRITEPVGGLDKWILYPPARRVPSRLRTNGVTASQTFNGTSVGTPGCAPCCLEAASAEAPQGPLIRSLGVVDDFAEAAFQFLQPGLRVVAVNDSTQKG